MKPKLLHVTDLYYQAKGRNYYEEDIYLSSQLTDTFNLVLCHPKTATAFLQDVDIVLFRNTGPVLYYPDVYSAFKTEALARGTKIFNQLSGKADMLGKQYLIDLTKEEYPVIPSVDDQSDLHRLPVTDRYVTKLKLGSDSVGMQYITRNDVEHMEFNQNLVQPVMDFDFEVSFYFINDEFQYALYAPDPNKRWRLESYNASSSDLEFARKFIEWNDIDFGIQRIDACKMPNGELFLMEIEDLNPYLSLDLLSDGIRNQFVKRLSTALLQFMKI